jgi:Ca-activated chloride channel family protein
MVLHCAYYHLLPFLAIILLCATIYRIKWYRYPVYVYPLTSKLHQQGLTTTIPYKKILSFIRFLLLGLLLFLILRPQWVDEKSKVNIEGVDIVLAIDASHSMTFFDNKDDERSRIDIAKEEAIRFIEKRTDDPIGIVVFGREALSRCPLTLDKTILKEIVGSLDIGIVDPRGTWLGTGLATAINRLRTSTAKSKIVILLTDGQPTPPEKIDPALAIDMAKKFGIKVYTIGIGNEKGGYIRHPLFGDLVRMPEDGLNVQLLENIAEQTGGTFFKAHNQQEMRMVYDKIDALEKTKMQTNIFHRYYEAFLNFIWIVLALLGLELALRLFVWRGILS